MQNIGRHDGEDEEMWSRQKMRQICSLMVFAAVLVLLVLYSSKIYGGFFLVLKIFKPFLYGGAIAFVLNLPMKWIEEKLLGRWKGRIASKCKRPLGIVGAFLFLVLVVAVVISIVIPQLTQAMKKLGNEIPVFLKEAEAVLVRYSEEYPELQTQIQQLQSLEINWQGIVTNVAGFLKKGVGSLMSSTFSVAGSIIGGVVNLFIAVVFAVYILGQKEKLANQGCRILRAYLPASVSAGFLKVLSLLYVNFSSFITGQCLEAVILGSMFVVTMTVVGMPYAVMVGVLIAFTALIPIVGAFIGCAVGAFLILIENPVMAFWFVVMFLVLQQIEGNLIYPRVVGNSVGLPSMWVLVAVSVGGSLFGVPGMLFFIPLLATAYALLRENVNKRNGVIVATTEADKPSKTVKKPSVQKKSNSRKSLK